MSPFNKRPRAHSRNDSSITASSSTSHTTTSTHESFNSSTNHTNTTNNTLRRAASKRLNSLPWRIPRSQRSTPSLLARPTTQIHRPSSLVEQSNSHLEDGKGYVYAPTAPRRPALDSSLFAQPAAGPGQAPQLGRPRSFASSIHSAASSTSLAADSIRRRSVLLDDEPFNASLQRATDVLRASERGRLEEGRRAERLDAARETDRLRRAQSQELLSATANTARTRFATINAGAERPRTYHMGNLLQPTAYPGQGSTNGGGDASSSQESVGLPKHLGLPYEPASKFSTSTGKVSYTSPNKKSAAATAAESSSGGGGGAKDKGRTLRSERSFKNLLAIKKATSSLSLRGVFGGNKDKEKFEQTLSPHFVQEEMIAPPRSTVTPSAPASRTHTRVESTSSSGTPSSRPSSSVASSSKESSSVSTASKKLLSKWSSAIKGKRVRKQVERFEAFDHIAYDASPATTQQQQQRQLQRAESPMVLALAEKVQVHMQAQQVTLTNQRPSRIALSAVFPNATASSAQPSAPRPAPAPPLEISPDTRSRKPTTSISRRSLKRRQTTASVPSFPAREAARNLEQYIPPPAPAPQALLAPQPPAAGRGAQPAPSSMRVQGTNTALLLPAATIRTVASDSFLRGKTVTRLSSDEESMTSSAEDGLLNPRRLTPPSPSPHRNSWRSPSPARFRDLLPSASASSSPEKNELDLPLPSDSSPRSSVDSGASKDRPSPKRCAMGPEQMIAMASSEETGEIVEVSCATSDLAELLSGLEDNDTTNLSVELSAEDDEERPANSDDERRKVDNSDLSASLRRYAHISSSDETDSDVPEDLQEMIRAVKDHLHDLPHSMPSPPTAHSFSPSSAASSSADGRTANTQQLLMPTAFFNGGGSMRSPNTADTTTFLSAEGSDTLFGRLSSHNGSTTGSFQGCAATAADALRAMLRGPAEPDAPQLTITQDVEAEVERELQRAEAMHLADESEEEEEVDDRGESARLRESARSALEVGRPSVGDKMLLSSLWGEIASAPSSPENTRPSIGAAQKLFIAHAHNASLASSSEFSLESSSASDSLASHGSPLANKARHSTLMRGALARYSARRPTAELLFARGGKAPDTLEEEDDDDVLRAAMDEVAVADAADSEREETGAISTGDETSLSLAQSVLSVGSRDPHGSPCPVVRGRYPMLTARRVSAQFRFPLPAMPPPAAPGLARTPSVIAAIIEEDQQVSPVRRAPGPGTPPAPSTERAATEEETSPFKRVFNPLEHFKNKTRQLPTDPSPTSANASASSSSNSPRYVRPLRLSRPGEELPAPRPLSTDELDSSIIPPDTPPPSSPSTEGSSAHSSLHAIADAAPVEVPMAVFEGHELETIDEVSSCAASPPEPAHEAAIADYFSAAHRRDPLSRFGDESFSDRTSDSFNSSEEEEDDAEEEEENAMAEMVRDQDDSGSDDTHDSDVLAPLPTAETFSLTYHPIHLPLSPSPISPHSHSSPIAAHRDSWEFDQVDECTWTAWHEFHALASFSLHESKMRWPDTDYSRAVMEDWSCPVSVHAMLEFLFASQNAWLSKPIVVDMDDASFELELEYDEIEVDYVHSPESSDLLGRIEAELNYRRSESSEERDSAAVRNANGGGGTFGYLHRNLDISPPVTDEFDSHQFQVEQQHRAPLARKPLNNARVAALARSASSPVKADGNPSPFTALPPKLNLGSKLRGVRAKINQRLSPDKKHPSSAQKENASPPSSSSSGGAGVQVDFLGDQGTRRRKGQYDAALRKLEGLGTPGEQREEGDSDGDESGVFEARGTAESAGTSAQGLFGFAKTPKLSTARPRVRPRTKLSNLR